MTADTRGTPVFTSACSILQRSCIRLWSDITCENTLAESLQATAVFSSPEISSSRFRASSEAFASSILARALDGRSSSPKPKPSGQTAAFRISPTMPLSLHTGFLPGLNNASKVMQRASYGSARDSTCPRAPSRREAGNLRPLSCCHDQYRHTPSAVRSKAIARTDQHTLP